MSLSAWSRRSGIPPSGPLAARRTLAICRSCSRNSPTRARACPGQARGPARGQSSSPRSCARYSCRRACARPRAASSRAGPCCSATDGLASSESSSPCCLSISSIWSRNSWNSWSDIESASCTPCPACLIISPRPEKYDVEELVEDRQFAARLTIVARNAERKMVALTKPGQVADAANASSVSANETRRPFCRSRLANSTSFSSICMIGSPGHPERRPPESWIRAALRGSSASTQGTSLANPCRSPRRRRARVAAAPCARSSPGNP